ncbi:MAG: hypothetical protein IKP20_04495 [Candidatus Methanomethylophilaceae archaeon]|nr:hypothetical protein [Candidatus Methanomethylophilaceae archaeon]
MEKVRSIGMKRFHSIMLALREGGASTMKALQGIVTNHAVLRGMLETMESEGLIEIKVAVSDRKTVGASLTPKGRAVADLLRDADLMVYRGDPDEPRGLDERKAADILIRLLDGPALQGDLMRVARSFGTVKKALGALDGDGLIAIESGGREIRVALTPLGERVARILAEAREAIASERAAEKGKGFGRGLPGSFRFRLPRPGSSPGRRRRTL